MTGQVEFNTAIVGNLDVWVPACGGTEKEFTCRGIRLLYCYNPALQKHAYLDLNSDRIMTDDEAMAILGI